MFCSNDNKHIGVKIFPSTFLIWMCFGPDLRQNSYALGLWTGTLLLVIRSRMFPQMSHRRRRERKLKGSKHIHDSNSINHKFPLTISLQVPEAIKTKPLYLNKSQTSSIHLQSVAIVELTELYSQVSRYIWLTFGYVTYNQCNNSAFVSRF